MPMKWTRSAVHARGRFVEDERRRAARDDARPHAKRQADERRASCGRTESRTAPAPGNPDSTSSTTARAVTAPPGSSQRGSWPKTIADARREAAAQAQLRQHAVQTVRPLAHFVEEQHVARGRLEFERRRRASEQLRQRAAEERPAGLAAVDDLEPVGRRARRAARCPGCAGTSRDRTPSSPRASRPSIIGPCTDARPAPHARNAWTDVTSL